MSNEHSAVGLRDYRLIALVLSISLFVQYFDSTSLITALPAIAKYFGRPTFDLDILIIYYGVVMAVAIPAGNAIGQYFGAKRAFLSALILFTLSSALCGLVDNLYTMLCGRILVALGAAIMLPTCRTILINIVKPAEFLSAMNWLFIPSIIGPLIAPPLSGFLVTYSSWKAIFFINVPIGLVGVAAGAFLIPRDPDDSTDISPFDTRGFILLSLCLGTTILGLNEIAKSTGVGRPGLELIAGLSFMALYIAHAARHPAPIIELSLLRIATFRVAIIIGSLIRMVISAVSFLLPLYFQMGFGLTAAASGALTFALAFGVLMSRMLSSPLLQYLSPRSLLIASASVTALTTGVMSLVNSATPPLLIHALLATSGFAGALPLTLCSVLAYVEVPRGRIAAATGFFTTIQQLTLSIGVTAASALTYFGGWVAGTSTNNPDAYAVAFPCLSILAAVSIAVAMPLSDTAGIALRRGRSNEN